MSVRHAIPRDNPLAAPPYFLTAPIGRLFWSNALPMAVVMSLSGVLSVVDGAFVGRHLGAEALAAVSLGFPLVMLIAALSTLAGGGMASLRARALGAGDQESADRVLAGAHGLALALSAVLVLLWAAFGAGLLELAGAGRLGVLAGPFLAILVWGAPVQLVLGLQADALRVEGRAGLVALLSVLVNLVNIAANWVGIVLLDLGIAGSAWGTLVAQGIGLVLVLGLRRQANRALWQHGWTGQWRAILLLGLPLCLSMLGIGLTGGCVILALRHHAPGQEAVVAAYGAVTRLLSLAFLPQLALAMALQAISGQNAGAGRPDRARAALRLGLGAAFLWCLGVALAGLLLPQTLGAWFSEDPALGQEIAAILRPILVLYPFAGPILVLAMQAQALGQPEKTALLTLVKPWLLMPLLVPGLSAVLGVRGIWLAFPLADLLVLGIALWMGLGLLGRGFAPGGEVR